MILTYNKDLIKNTLGRQGSSQCGVYSVAYGWTILEKKCRVSGRPASHQSVANKYNGGTYAVCYWSRMGLVSNKGSSARDRYGKIIKELNKGRPVVVAVQGSSTNHYVLVIGVRDGKSSSNVQPSDFYIIDPADCGIGYFGSTWAKGFNNSGYGLQFCTFNTNKSAGSSGSAAGGSGPEHPQSWYINKYGTGAEVYFELEKYGYSHKACCAVLGNMEQESGIRTYTGGSYDGNGSEGLCQWTFDRKKKMMDYAAKHSKSKSWKSVDGQVAYLVWELNNTEKPSNKVLKNNSLSLKEMTEAFEIAFERAGNKQLAKRVQYAKNWDERMSGAGNGEDGTEGEETGNSVSMRQRIDQLYSSANYNWVQKEEKEEEETEEQKKSKERQKVLTDYLTNLKVSVQEGPSTAISGDLLPKAKKKETIRKVANTVLDISQAMVETPFVEIDFGGTIIGTYNNSVDNYPNHISKLEVDKINGEINKYTFDLIHQIRAGEDPNLIDKVISKVRYSTIGIKYGDYTSNVIYGDEKAIITNVSMNRDYVSNRISYTIYATSAGELITSHKLNFTAKTSKPSTVINDLLYNNSETSELLLNSFPGMRNSGLVYSANLIPNNDSVLNIDEKQNISTIEYINYLVGCMSNVSNSVNNIIRNSTYYISYENDFNNKLGGAFFKIHEVSQNVLKNSNQIYEVTVGYPDNNYVMGFSVQNNLAWSVLYENASISNEYIYSIDDKGRKIKEYSPNLMNSSSNINEIQKNWWTQMINFPINATLTLKGLMKPIMLMDYIIVNVVFYGQQHITSGVYTITGQKDILAGDGFRTVLALTRISN